MPACVVHYPRQVAYDCWRREVGRYKTRVELSYGHIHTFIHRYSPPPQNLLQYIIGLQIMTKPAFRAFLFCVMTAIALVYGSGATLANLRNEDIASTMAFNGMYRISQVRRLCHLCCTLWWWWWWWLSMKVATFATQRAAQKCDDYIHGMYLIVTCCLQDVWSGQ